MKRSDNNPILESIPENLWESKAVFNPGAIYLDGKVHLLYRAMSGDNTSVLGYASSRDGFQIDERLKEPVYVPREDFEKKAVPDANSGCEDPRLTKIGDKIYMLYTAYDGKNPTHVALTSINEQDFLNKRWNWAKPVLISSFDDWDKDAAIFPKKFNGKYAILHRLGVDIWIDFAENLNFNGTEFIKGRVLMSPRFPLGQGHSKKIGIAGPPIETEKGWLLLYHGISDEPDVHYHLRAALLDFNDPTKVIARTNNVILEPAAHYEMDGLIPHVVFCCGSVIIGGTLFVYYGGADTVVAVATLKVKDLLEELESEAAIV